MYKDGRHEGSQKWSQNITVAPWWPAAVRVQSSLTQRHIGRNCYGAFRTNELIFPRSDIVQSQREATSQRDICVIRFTSHRLGNARLRRPISVEISPTSTDVHVRKKTGKYLRVAFSLNVVLSILYRTRVVWLITAAFFCSCSKRTNAEQAKPLFICSWKCF